MLVGKRVDLQPAHGMVSAKQSPCKALLNARSRQGFLVALPVQGRFGCCGATHGLRGTIRRAFAGLQAPFLHGLRAAPQDSRSMPVMAAESHSCRLGLAIGRDDLKTADFPQDFDRLYCLRST
jgi:hypothetical protein